MKSGSIVLELLELRVKIGPGATQTSDLISHLRNLSIETLDVPRRGFMSLIGRCDFCLLRLEKVRFRRRLFVLLD